MLLCKVDGCNEIFPFVEVENHRKRCPSEKCIHCEETYFASSKTKHLKECLPFLNSERSRLMRACYELEKTLQDYNEYAEMTENISDPL
ncbi:Oidioi.mRNA.OKI2018_I69.XSR.g15248.t1.cds [Oikopleura dioica]|uniref:Oidioi.mRNA.OKI2018_I69.XSR.g15248.t1.cds n=1 Tax=Oikopleura dioica TaxID=34765 RepID=A0ABN7SC93_OIKDI|nr:Oidioi.mRNA.OKI2018_I69.XSR.g15248.t1.cds [Oikopleura dioica]